MAKQTRKPKEQQPSEAEFYADEQRVATNEGMPTPEEQKKRQRSADNRRKKSRRRREGSRE